LVQEVPDIDAAKRIHLGEGENAGENKFVTFFVRCVPADGHDFVVFFDAVDGHWHVVIGGDDLEEVVTETLLKEFGIFLEEAEK